MKKSKIIRFIRYYILACIACLIVNLGFEYFLGWPFSYLETFIFALFITLIMILIKRAKN